MEVFPLKSLLFLIIILIANNQTLAEILKDQNFCRETKCGKDEPTIRFPFRLENGCGFPGFDLICVENKTVLALPGKTEPVFVRKIDYKLQEIRVYGRSNCLPKHLLFELNQTLNSTSLRFKYHGDRKSSYTLLNCPTRDHPCRSIVVRSDSEVQASYVDIISCTKIREFEAVPDEIHRSLWQGNKIGSDIVLEWLEPDCRLCEFKGQGCRLKKFGAKVNEIECSDRLRAKSKISLVTKITTIAISVSLFVFLVFGTIFYLYTSKKNKKAKRERIEKFLDDYNALKPSRYSYSDIKKITNDFEDIIGQGENGTVFKGKLSNEVLVAVKILKNNSILGNGEEFVNEVATTLQIHHVNVVRLVGYCADGYIRAFVFEYLSNGSLEKHISSEPIRATIKTSLGWETLYNIALGIAKGIEYLHQGCAKRILHFDINPRNILLDDNFVPKISDFGLAKLCSKDQSAVSMDTARGTKGYIAPEVFSRNFGAVSFKSDVYSFGMLLLEMIGGRKNTKEDEIYFPEWVFNLLQGGGDLRIVVQGDDNAKIAKRLAIVGLWCIQWCPMDRPTMKNVIQMLEGDKDLTIPPNPFVSVGSSTET